jgi:transcriptional regulator with XRE-family HTH domain
VRAERAAEAKALRDKGLTQIKIAVEMGISRSYAAELLSDPTGEGSRARKRVYCGTCRRCGVATTGSNGRALAPKFCKECTATIRHDLRRWTQEAIIGAIQLFARRHGRPPSASEWLYGPRLPCYPPVSVVQREFGSWANGIVAAGFPRNSPGSYERTARTKEIASQSMREYWMRKKAA